MLWGVGAHYFCLGFLIVFLGFFVGSESAFFFPRLLGVLGPRFGCQCTLPGGMEPGLR